MTLVLWDIDHTLIETRGVGGELYQAAFEEITGRKLERMPEITGRTELTILAETLKLHGIEPGTEYAAKYTEALARQYEQHGDELRQRGQVLPGAKEALVALSRRPTVVQAALTGNLRAVAMTKLRVFELDQYIDFEVSAYGDDEVDRTKLVVRAQQRATARHGTRFNRRNTVIVGDSPSDVETGLEGGARVIAVASGRTSAEELRKAGATTVLNDLVNTPSLARAVSAPDAAE
ncbi:MAG: haloacid dehalogenase-like hydrolase [Geodermatophilaceae bacterium]|nr:haloacid dehalogenase-like hydrolase [Geodermatophilaceae bacterium]